MTRHFTAIDQLSDAELDSIYTLATTPFDDETLKGQGVALIFERPSLRTRASSSSAVHELGGYATFFGDEEIGLDRRESAEDVARTIAEMYTIAALRIRQHGVFARMRTATNERLSLVNLLSDVAHPTQAVADVLTIADEFAQGDVNGLAGLSVAYVGDATNVTRSLAVALLRLGVNVTVGAPEGYQLASGGAEDPMAVNGPGLLRLTDSAHDAVVGANVVYTDAWVSMGFEEESARRRFDLADFQVNAPLMSLTDEHAILMHCLPAHRGDEVTNEVLDSEQSRVWRQVFHRRSAMMGVLRWIKGES
ncbi:MAG TPA: ornithine carbamoyltransferase [Acidimicrobiales bacterium]|jgi:ornithine carbamoyltransferase|nr:ornithine carbamoyltransferase [Acidimicrobiales bacterium]